MTESWENYRELDRPALLDYIFYLRRDDYKRIDSAAVQEFDAAGMEQYLRELQTFVAGQLK